MTSPFEALTIRLAAEHANDVRKALQDSVSVSRLVEDWYRQDFNSMSSEEARQWVKTHAAVHKAALNDALRYLYATGFVLGHAYGMKQYANATGYKKAAPSGPSLVAASLYDWATWKPGNLPAAALVSPPRGLSKLLDSRHITVNNVTDTTMNRLGTYLAATLKAGTTVERISVTEAIKGAEDLMDDPARAQTIAETEMTRAVSVAARDLYETSNVEYVEWLVAEGCDDCQENADASPIPIDATFPSGDSEPPAHPNCMCALAPYVVDTRDVAEGLAASFEGE
jgi:hypothetical protein